MPSAGLKQAWTGAAKVGGPIDTVVAAAAVWAGDEYEGGTEAARAAGRLAQEPRVNLEAP